MEINSDSDGSLELDSLSVPVTLMEQQLNANFTLTVFVSCLLVYLSLSPSFLDCHCRWSRKEYRSIKVINLNLRCILKRERGNWEYIVSHFTFFAIAAWTKSWIQSLHLWYEGCIAYKRQRERISWWPACPACCQNCTIESGILYEMMWGMSGK